ncbi:Transcription elongation factor spt6 [Phlyctochytrium planicorne]|nr:Transcription elongation factor spt6 [Phlyctochytrium planicorne]
MSDVGDEKAFEEVEDSENDDRESNAGSDSAVVKKKKKRIIDSDDDSSEEDEDEEMTEADKQFIVDDDEDEDEEGGAEAGGEGDEERDKEIRKKKKRKARQEEENLDEDDLDLIQENFGRTKKDKFKRLRKKGEEPPPRRIEQDLSNMFEEDEAVEAEDEDKRTKAPEYDDDLQSEDDDDNFIVDDEDDGGEEDEASRKAKAEQKRQSYKNRGQSYGISNDILQDIDDLFGDGSDYAYALYPKGSESMEDLYEDEDQFSRPSQEKSAPKLTDIYEPSEIEARMLTEADEAIQIRDMPERFQARGDLASLSEEDYDRSARFIFRTAFSSDDLNNRLNNFVDGIKIVLKFFHEEKYEVPFIVAHRRDRTSPFKMDRADLWKIYDADMVFQALETRRKNVRALLTDIRKWSDACVGDIYPETTLDEANTPEGIADVVSYLQLHYGVELHRAQEGRRRELKRTYRKTLYDEGRNANLLDFVKLFGIDVKEFGVALSQDSNRHAPVDIHERPLFAAGRFTKERSPFDTAERVLEVSRQMLASTLSTDPKLRDFIREIYKYDAFVSCIPTEKGKQEIQPLHPFYSFKYLYKKDVKKFANEKFLQIAAAEEQGLITLKIEINEDRLMDDVYKCITNDYTNEFAELWNSERRKVADLAFKGALLPSAAKWLRDRLIADASDWLADQCRYLLEQKIDVAPFKRERGPDDYDDDEKPDFPRVMSISWGDGDRDSPTIVVCLDEDGHVSDRKKLNRMQQRDDKAKDHQVLKDLIKEFQPDVIVVGGWTIQTKTRLLPDLAGLISELDDHGTSDRNYRDRRRRDRFVKPELVMLDDEVARLAMTSKRYIKEFPDPFPAVGRYCVSLGRRVQDATMEYATLFNNDEEYKLLRIHPHQTLLRDDKLKSAFERAFINVVNFKWGLFSAQFINTNSGVDINEAASPLLKHRSCTLQFVSGLGPRKAQFLIDRILNTGGKIESRTQLIENRMVTSSVFMNCASFIRIRKQHLYSDAQYDVLDDTRIHPEDYDLARKMAADALDIDESPDSNDPSAHVADLMEGEPEKVELLMLEEYAKELERRTNELKYITLMDIKAELIAPYRDRRRRFAGATYAEVFTMLTNENSETLRPGIVMPCRVIKVFERFVKVVLNSGLEGIIHNSKFPLNSSGFTENQFIQAAILSVDVEKAQVELDAREDAVGKEWLQRIGQTLHDKDWNAELEMSDDRKRPVIMRPQKPKQARSVQHPFWKNFTYQEAVDYLSSERMRRGSIVIRPSTKGNDHLSMTWKIDENVFQHIDISESRKENEWSVGKVLTVENKQYDDLDEIVATYIEPMGAFFNEVTQHPKFKRLPYKEMCRWVGSQAAANRRSTYGVIISQEKPGQLTLVYQHPSARIKHDYISVGPDGFTFRNKKYRRLDAVFDGFKRDESEWWTNSRKTAWSNAADDAAVPK